MKLIVYIFLLILILLYGLPLIRFLLYRVAFYLKLLIFLTIHSNTKCIRTKIFVTVQTG